MRVEHSDVKICMYPLTLVLDVQPGIILLIGSSELKSAPFKHAAWGMSCSKVCCRSVVMLFQGLPAKERNNEVELLLVLLFALAGQ